MSTEAQINSAIADRGFILRCAWHGPRIGDGKVYGWWFFTRQAKRAPVFAGDTLADVEVFFGINKQAEKTVPPGKWVDVDLDTLPSCPPDDKVCAYRKTEGKFDHTRRPTALRVEGMGPQVRCGGRLLPGRKGGDYWDYGVCLRP